MTIEFEIPSELEGLSHSPSHYLQPPHTGINKGNTAAMAGDACTVITAHARQQGKKLKHLHYKVSTHISARSAAKSDWFKGKESSTKYETKLAVSCHDIVIQGPRSRFP
jgi:hypothetical protein